MTVNPQSGQFTGPATSADGAGGAPKGGSGAPAQVAALPASSLSEGESGNPATQALVSVAAEPEADCLPLGRALRLMPVELDVVVPVRNFRVRSVLALEPGQVIESQWNPSEDVPLSAGEVRLAWTEFEVIEDQLAVRVTRLP